jgi:hypothetical protein
MMVKEDDEDCCDMSALVVDQRVGVVFQVIQTSGYRVGILFFSGNGYKQRWLVVMSFLDTSGGSTQHV